MYAILYSDGTFVFQDSDKEDASHGTVVAKYNSFLDNVYTANDQIPWTANRSNIKSIEMKCKVKPADTTYMFYGLPNLTSCDIRLLDTSKSGNMKYMFYNCTNLAHVDCTNFDTSNVSDMQHMFKGCNKLKLVKVGNKFLWVSSAARLPVTSSSDIPDADGKWYNSKCVGYLPENILDNVVDTYYASKNLVPSQ